jgi:hypothetical protein
MEIEILWKSADAAWDRGIQAYLDWCIEIKKIYDAGGATQEQIGTRYDRPRNKIVEALGTASDLRVHDFLKVENVVVRDKQALYLLTTLDDDGFKELAKPGVTQAKILEYKRRLKAPEPAKVVAPPQAATPVIEKHATPEETAALWARVEARQAAEQALEPQLPVFSLVACRQFVVTFASHADEQQLLALLKAMRPLVHPDRGGDHDMMTELNKYYEQLKDQE